MTRYRHQETPNAPGVQQLTGGSTLYNTIDLPKAFELMTYDTVVPNYRLRSANGEIFNNPFSSTKITCSAVGGYVGTASHSGMPTNFNHTRTIGGLLYVGDPFLDLPTIDDDDLRSKCRIEAAAAVNKTEVDTLNFAAEWSKTKMLHRDIGNSFLKLFEESAKYKRGHLKRIPLYDFDGNPLLNKKGHPRYKYHSVRGELKGSSFEKTKTLSDLYLAGRMGVLPLLSDLEGAVKVLSQNKALRNTARNYQVAVAQRTAVKLIADNWGKTWSIDCLRTRSYSVRCGILYETSAAGRMMGQLGLTRPLTSLWNSMPWTFVCDWFLQVGHWLDAVQPSGASKTLCAWESTQDTIVDSMTVDDSVNGTFGDDVVNVSWKESFVRTRSVKNRVPWDTSIPSSPSSGLGFDLMRSADFAALVLQRIPSVILKP